MLQPVIFLKHVSIRSPHSHGRNPPMVAPALLKINSSPHPMASASHLLSLPLLPVHTPPAALAFSCVSRQPYLVSPPGSLHVTWNALLPPDLDCIFLSTDFALFLDLPSVPTFPQAKVELGFKSLFQQIRDKWYMTTVIKNKLLPILFNWGYPKTLKQDLSGINSNSYT